MRKRIVSALLALAVILALGGWALADGVTITVGSVTASAGSAFIAVPVSIAANPGIAAANLQAGETAEGIELTAVIADWDGWNAENGASFDYENGLLTSGSFAANAENGKIAWANGENTAGDGCLFYLVYSIAEEVPAGSYDISLSMTDGASCALGNAALERVETAFSAGTLTVTEKNAFTGDYLMYPEISGTADVSVGDTVEMGIYICAQSAGERVSSFEGVVEYDMSALTLTAISSPLPITANTASGAFSYAGEPVEAGTGKSPVLVATAEFTVRETIKTGRTVTEIGIASAQVSPAGALSPSVTAVGAPALARLHNLTVTFEAGAGASGGSVTYYARYGRAGLYATNAYADALTGVTGFTALSGFVLPSLDGYLSVSFTENTVITVNGIGGNVAGDARIIGSDEYGATPKGKELLIFTPTDTSLPPGASLVFDRGGAGETALVYSPGYGAWTGFIPENSESPESGVTADEAPGTTLSFAGDVNANGRLEAIDALIASDMYLGYAYDDAAEAEIALKYMRLRADANGDETVNTSDVVWVLRSVVGLKND